MVKWYYSTILIFVISWSNQVDSEKGKALYRLHQSIEYAAKDKFHDMTRVYRKVKANVAERGSYPEDQKVVESIEVVLQKTDEIRDGIQDWKYRLIEDSGGEDYYGFIEGWNRKISPMSSKPENIRWQPNESLKKPKSTVVALLELSNLELDAINKSYKELKEIEYDYFNKPRDGLHDYSAKKKSCTNTR